MLNIQIFDVNHGFCAAVQSGENSHLLIDCGYHTHRKFYPSKYLFRQSIHHLDYLIVPTLVDGSLAGFYDLMGYASSHCLSIDRILINPSIDQESLPELMVRNFHSRGLTSFLMDICQRCSAVERTVHWGEVELAFFWNTYPEFLDFSNLSLVTFLSYQGINIIFPGNLKLTGWRSLLHNPRFRERLRHVNMLVTSNAGQIDGYCPEVFDYCHPHLSILAACDRDQSRPTAVRHYDYQMQRIWELGQSRVLMTRNTGMITIQPSSTDLIQVITERFKTYCFQTTEVHSA